MIVMPSNNTGFVVGLMQGRYGRLGWLYNAVTDGGRGVHHAMPWALDNGAYGAHSRGEEWPEDDFYAGLERLRAKWSAILHPPRWIAVPDSVGDRAGTLERWHEHARRIAAYGAPLAFVVQDDMTPDDVPHDAAVVFVGGSTDWKWRSLPTWTAHFPRVHVGRVNGYTTLHAAHSAGAESVDGTGLLRTDKQRAGLQRYLEDVSGNKSPFGGV